MRGSIRLQDARLCSQGWHLAIHKRSAEISGLSTSILSEAPEELHFRVALMTTPYLSAGARCLLGNVVPMGWFSDQRRITFSTEPLRPILPRSPFTSECRPLPQRGRSHRDRPLHPFACLRGMSGWGESWGVQSAEEVRGAARNSRSRSSGPRVVGRCFCAAPLIRVAPGSGESGHEAARGAAKARGIGCATRQKIVGGGVGRRSTTRLPSSPGESAGNSGAGPLGHGVRPGLPCPRSGSCLESGPPHGSGSAHRRVLVPSLAEVPGPASCGC